MKWQIDWWKTLSVVVGIAALVICGARFGRSEPATSESSPVAEPQRQREGAVIVDVLGRFKMTGDRATFVPLDRQVGFAGLENLNLERVTQMLSDNADQQTWLISGTLTEFRGVNYILISKAVLKSQNEAGELSNARGRARPRRPAAESEF